MLQTSDLINPVERPSTVAELNSAEEGALNYYTGDAFKDINGALNSGRSELFQETVSEIDSALKKLPSYEGTVTRTVDFHGYEDKLDDFLLRHSQGKIVQYDQYLSTSYEGFYGGEFGGKYKINMIIHSKNGKKISMYARDPNEHELLFGRGSKFKIDRVFTKELIRGAKPTKYIEMTEI